MDTTEIEFMMNAQISTKTNNDPTTYVPQQLLLGYAFKGVFGEGDSIHLNRWISTISDFTRKQNNFCDLSTLHV